MGAFTLVGYIVVGIGLVLSWMSRPQLVVCGSSLLIGLPAWLSIALWFLLLGRNLGKHDHRREDQAVENISLVVTLRRRPSGRVVL